MGQELLDLYSDYLLYSSGQTAAGFSMVLDGTVSHDKAARFLASEYFDEKNALEKSQKDCKGIRRGRGMPDICGTIIEKPYMNGNDILCRHCKKV
ncbi:MAG: hypothetical protein LBD29_09695 [Treponema sp.]|jgi:hypothetical protein|nr:hypothetical protein [Treponema sp.]